MEAASLTVRARGLPAAAPAHGAYRRATATAPRFGARQHHRLRALPPELTEILAPKLVPGSPADTGDTSALIPISGVMLLFYFVSNWVFPAVIMRGMEPDAEDEAASTSSSSPPQGDAIDGQAGSSKIRLKVKKKKKKKSSKTAMEV